LRSKAPRKPALSFSKGGKSLTKNWATAFDPTAQMVFAQPDMAAVAERAQMASAPGATWRYSNGNTMILARIIRDSVGGDAASVFAFVHRELFGPLGMTHSTLEFDAAGTPLGATHIWAPARDWARLGLIYLNDGIAGASASCRRAGSTIRRGRRQAARPLATARDFGRIAAIKPPSGPRIGVPTCRRTPSWPTAVWGSTSSSCPRRGL
jgi:CubicO group peptidase (beta-lactamase class C family)